MTNIIKNLKAFLYTDWGKLLLVAILWQGLMTLFGAFSEASTFGIFKNEHLESISTTLLSHTYHWDAGWYKSIIEDWYRTNAASPVFYPLFPLLVGLLHTLTFGILGILASGLLINTIALWLSLVALVQIADHFVPKEYRWYIPLLFLTAPTAIFMHFFYGEAVFCAVGFWAYNFALKRRWLPMALTLGLLTASRLPSILFIGLCALEYARAYNWQLRSIVNKRTLFFLLTPLGFVIYGVYLAIVRNDFWAMFNGYKASNDWPYQVFNPNVLETWINSAKELRKIFTTNIPFDEGFAVNYLLPLVGIALLLLCSFLLITFYGTRKTKRIGIPLGIFGIVCAIFFSLNSNLISVDRYLLPCLSLYVYGGLLAAKYPSAKYIVGTLVYSGILLQAYLLMFFVNNYFAG